MSPQQWPIPFTELSQSQLERARTLHKDARAAIREGDFMTYEEINTELSELLEEADTARMGNETTDSGSACP